MTVSSQKRMSQCMVQSQLITNKILDKRILSAMNNVSRSEFLPANLQGIAYIDEDLALANGRFLMEPLTFAQLLNLAQITEGCRVLIVGCLSGYSAAVIAQMAHHIVAVDSDAEFIAQTRQNVKRLNLSNIDVEQVKVMADGYALSAPYNVILVEGALETVPDNLSSQLAKDGRLVAVRNVAKRPGMKGGLGKGVLVKRIDGKTLMTEHFDASVPLLPGFTCKQSFVFYSSVR